MTSTGDTNDKSGGENDSPKAAHQHENIFDFLIAAISEKYLQIETDYINKIAAPSELKFKNV